MVPVFDYQMILDHLKFAFSDYYAGPVSVRTVGLLFAPPTTRVAKEEIIPRLDGFHHRSGKNLDIFCCGYGPAESQPVEHTGKLNWDFDDRVFHEIRERVEADSQWIYSGEADLLLVDARQSESGQTTWLDYREAMPLDIDALLRRETITSFGRFFQRLCHTIDNMPPNATVKEVSTRLLLPTAASGAMEGLFELAPKAVRNAVVRGNDFRVRDLSRPNVNLRVGFKNSPLR